jgi:hypothetical protein
MDKRAEYLKTLGLPADATWEEVTQTYKDLMRVWHPDRFQGDDRLRRKAEQEAQRINHAMTELKKLGKEPPPQPKGRSSTRPSTDTQSADSRSGAQPRPSSTQGTFQTRIRPLIIRQRPVSSIIRGVGALGVAYLTFLSMADEGAEPMRRAFAASLTFAFLDTGIRNILLLCVPCPVVTVNRTGLFTLRTGKLGWLDLDQVWPELTPRSMSLNLNFSPHYVDKQGLLVRLLIKVRALFGSKHVSISFNTLNGDPVQVLNALKLQRLHDFVVEDFKPSSTRIPVRLAQLICLASACLVVIRFLLRQDLTSVDYLPYLAIFVIARIFHTVMTLVQNISLQKR